LSQNTLKKQDFPVFTVYEAAFYYQNLSTFFPPKKDDEGTWVFSLPETATLTMFDVKDTGPIVAAIFKDPEGTNKKTIAAAAFHGSPQEVIDTIGKVSGQKVKLNNIPRDVFAKFPFPGAAELADMFGWFNEYTYFGPNLDLNSGKSLSQMTSFESWVQSDWKPPSN